MRKAINDNPVVQIGVLGVLLVVVGLLMMTRVAKKDEEPAEPAAASAAASSTSSAATNTAAGSTPAGTTAPTTVPGTDAAAQSAAPAGASPAASSTSIPPEALVPGPGLPREVMAAWSRGDAIVLLIVRGGAADDTMVRRSVDALSEPGTAVFVTRAKHIARYSRITQGVGVNRVPALVVVRPRRISGGIPQAEVSYGFRNSQSVIQAVRDALYSGRDDIPYSPG